MALLVRANEAYRELASVWRTSPITRRGCPLPHPLDQIVTVLVDERDQYLDWRSTASLT